MSEPPDVTWIIDRECIDVGIEGHATFFDFDGAGLHVASVWRIMSQGKIALGSIDHGQWFGLTSPVDAAVEARRLLESRRVINVQLLAESSDLVLLFEGGVRLEVWNDSSGYEAWSATCPGHAQVIALGGGGLATVDV